MAYTTDSFDDEVVRRLKAGGAGLLPTDTIYGLSCRALDRGAVERIRRLKDRGAQKPFIVLISDIKMLDLLSISKEKAGPAKKYWPARLSVVLPSLAQEFLTQGTSSLAVRVPDYKELRELIEKVGPIVSTSANIEGGEPARTVEEAKKLFGDQLDFYVDVGELDNPPSTLAVVEGGRLKAVRPGAVKID